MSDKIDRYCLVSDELKTICNLLIWLIFIIPLSPIIKSESPGMQARLNNTVVYNYFYVYYFIHAEVFLPDVLTGIWLFRMQ